ncbi:MAG: hypothetical protein JO149_00300 [Gammaproteobacteria bacterium]|nr:hypothetical protein [Gammaproteobacteria bacterium]
MRLHYLKKFFILLGAASLVSLVSMSNVKADTTPPNPDYLALIEQHTNNILQRVNDLPTYLQNLAQMAIAFTTPDTSDTTAKIQGNFTQLGNLLNQNLTTQITMQQQLNADLLGPNTTRTTMPYANDLIYSTVLGQPFFPTDPRNPPGKTPTTNPIYNYIKNSSGIGISHLQPSTWNGPLLEQQKYQNYYNTVMAIESFNAFVLSNQYADGGQLNNLQQTLIAQATDPQNWLGQVASENIGFVLRQILLYQSQMFVLLTQLVQTEKQIATAAVMTNSLLILNNQQNENMLITKAQGVRPTA